MPMGYVGVRLFPKSYYEAQGESFMSDMSETTEPQNSTPAVLGELPDSSVLSPNTISELKAFFAKHEGVLHFMESMRVILAGDPVPADQPTLDENAPAKYGYREQATEGETTDQPAPDTTDDDPAPIGG